jgi:DNA polymerase III gamma/tau subunit
MLYQKYRPRKFSEIIANTASKQALLSLSRKFKEGKPVPHAYLFTGPSGCGKTTAARILAKKYGSKGFNLIEMDSADFRGIDTIREIRQQAQLASMDNSPKFWILDECQQLSKDAQSALLKILEDTPAHVYFALATTDPEKLLPTIRTRLTTFVLSKLDDDEINELLSKVVEKEGAIITKEAIKQICLDCLGSARMALVLLDKIIDLPVEEQQEVAKQTARTENQVIELCRLLIQKTNWKQVSSVLRGLSKEDPEKVRRAVLGYANSVLLNSGNPRAYLVIDSFRKPVWDIGMPGLIAACYEVLEV